MDFKAESVSLLNSELCSENFSGFGGGGGGAAFMRERVQGGKNR